MVHYNRPSNVIVIPNGYVFIMRNSPYSIPCNIVILFLVILIPISNIDSYYSVGNELLVIEKFLGLAAEQSRQACQNL